MKEKLEQIFDKHHEGFAVYNKDEIIKELLVLYNVVGRSEQFFCECPNNFDIYQETKVYHSSCNKEVKVIRTK